MKGTIEELWHGNIILHEDSRTNSPEMKELLSYMARHHEDLEKSFTDEQKETFEKFHDCWSELHEPCGKGDIRVCLQAWWKVDARNTIRAAQKLIRSKQRKKAFVVKLRRTP